MFFRLHLFGRRTYVRPRTMTRPDAFAATDPHRYEHSLGEVIVGVALSLEAMGVGAAVAFALADAPAVGSLVALAVGALAAALAGAGTVAAGRRIGAAVARLREARDDDREPCDPRDARGSESPVGPAAEPHRR